MNIPLSLLLNVIRANDFDDYFQVLLQLRKHLPFDGMLLRISDNFLKTENVTLDILERLESIAVLKNRKKISHQSISDNSSEVIGHAVFLSLDKGDILGSLIFYRKLENFDRQDLVILKEAYPHLVWAFGQIVTRQLLNDQLHSIKVFFRGLPTSLLILSWDLEILHANEAARLKLSEIQYGHDRYKIEKRVSLPKELYDHVEVCKQNLIDQSSEVREFSSFENPRIQYRITFFASSNPNTIYPGLFFITTSKNNPLMTTPPELGLLSTAEQAVFRCSQQGMGSKQIARVLKKSQGTIKNQLHSIYQKLKVKDRIELLQKFGMGTE